MLVKRHVIDEMLRLGDVVFVFDGTEIKTFTNPTSCMLVASHAKGFRTDLHGILTDLVCIPWKKIYCAWSLIGDPIVFPRDIPVGYSFNVDDLIETLSKGNYSYPETNLERN